MHARCKAFTLLDIHVTQIGKRTVLGFAPTVHEHRPECPRPGSVVAQCESAALLKGSAIVLAESPATTRFDGTHCGSTISTSFVTFLFTVNEDNKIRAAEAGPGDLPAFLSSSPLPSSRNSAFPSE